MTSICHLSISRDVDAAAGSLTVTLTTSTGGNLSASSGGGVTVGGSGTGVLTLDGTLADLNTYFNTTTNITYLHGTPFTSGDNADTIQVEINDNGSTGTGGGTDINLGTVNVDIGAVNDDPTNAGSVCLPTLRSPKTFPAKSICHLSISRTSMRPLAASQSP